MQLTRALHPVAEIRFGRNPDSVRVFLGPAQFFNEMKKSLAKNDRVEIRGLCTFYVRKYRQFTGRNPKTGEKVTVKPKKLPYFKMGSDIKRRLNP